MGHPFLRGTVYSPRLDIVRRVDFLVDTGCAVTTIHPMDAVRMGLDHEGLVVGRDVLGIGGRQREYTEQAMLAFPHGPGVVTYAIDIDIAPVTEHNRWLASLLGMDVIQHWRMVCDVRNDDLSFAVNDGDATALRDTP